MWFLARDNHILQFADGNAIPDVHGQLAGAGTQGHQVIAAPYDGREAGPLMRRLRKTMRETSFMGMPIMAGADLMAAAAGEVRERVDPGARARVPRVYVLGVEPLAETAMTASPAKVSSGFRTG